MSLDRPVLVTGTPRSGKSVAAELLARLDEFSYMVEPLMVWDIGLGTRADDIRTADEVTDQTRASIVQSCQSLIKAHPNTRYLDDLAYHALRIPFVNAVMPEARIIHVIRDPRQAIPEMIYGWLYKDTVGKAFMRRRKAIRLSTLPRHGVRFLKNQIVRRVKGRRSTWGPRVPGMAKVVASEPVAVIAAYQWMQMVQNAMDDMETLPEGRCLEVRFDRLLKDPGGEALRIGRFCDVESPEKLAEIAKAVIDPAFIFDKQIEPTPSEWAVINDMIGPLKQRLGYTD